MRNNPRPARKIPRIFSRYTVIEIELPAYPDVDWVVDIPARTIYVNVLANGSANVVHATFRKDYSM